MEPVDSPRTPVEKFSLPVVGGTFVVAEVMLPPGQNAGQIVDSIRSQPMERWLVMTASENGLQSDALAIINDAFECQVVALGSLRTEGG